jgi:hypothetical protein
MSATGELELLQRHAPLLLLDRLERWAPVAVEPFLEASAVMRGSGALLSGPPALLDGEGADDLHLDPTPETDAARRAHALFDRFAPPPPPAEWRCYGTVERLAGGRRALVYWFFYADNPFGIWFTDVGRHVGDWEQVQVELDASGRLAAVAVYQHGSAHRVPVGSRDLTLTADGRPRVYVAEGSHAAYLTAGSQPRKLKRDNTSDGGRSGVPVVVPLRDGGVTERRASWHGRWGPDTGPVLRVPAWLLALVKRLAGGSLGGDSPPGPLARGVRRTSTAPATPPRTAPTATPGAPATAPAAPAGPANARAAPAGSATVPAAPAGPATARAAPAGPATAPAGRAPPTTTPGRFAPNAWLSRALRVAGRATWPRDVAIESVAREGGAVRVRLRTGGGGLRAARYADAVVADADGAPVGFSRARVRARGAELLVAPIRGSEPAVVRAAAYNRLDQRSDVVERPLPA